MDEFDVLKEETIQTDVYVRVGVTKIYDIDTINQRFNAEILIESKWAESSLESIDDDLTGKLKEAWKPELYVENALGDPKEEITYKIVRDGKGLMLSEIRKVKGVFWENLELENFPLDIQDLSVNVASRKSTKRVNLIPMQAEYTKVQISNTLDRSAWKLNDIIRTSKDTLHREYSFGRREYPCVRLTCQAFRLPGYFYWNALLPILLISFASLGPFLIDYKAAHTRLPSTATMLLASVSYKSTVGRLLPTVSYLTSLDKYGLASIVLIALMFIYHSLFSAVNFYLTDSVANLMDKIAFIAFLCLILTKQLVYVTWLFNVNNYRKKLIEEARFHQTITVDAKKKKD